MKKKIVALFLISTMCLTGMTACGKKEAPEETIVETATDDAEKAEKTKEVKEEAPVAVGGDTLDTNLWTVNYDSSVWSYDEDVLYDSESCVYSELAITDGDSTKVTIEIDAEISGPFDFRDKLYNYGLDEYEYVENGAYDRVDIGGIEFVTTTSTYYGDDCVIYLGRVEHAKESVFIKVYGDVSDSNIDSLLAGISFKISDIGNVDGPWYWEGEPIRVADLSGTVGSFTVSTHQLVMDEPDITHETFGHRIALVGDKVYVLSKDEVKAYNYDGSALTFDTSYTLDNEYSEIQATPDGTLIISDFMKPMIEWKDGTIINDYSSLDTSYVAMHPSGTWGISFFANSECAKVTVNGDGTGSMEDLAFPEVSLVQHVNVSDNYIFVCGSPEDGDHAVYVYDLNGSYVMTLTKDEGSFGLGSCTYVAETANGFMAMDGNMREVVFWDKSGAYIGSLEDGDLFGTNYPWFCGSATLEDGTVLTIMTEERPDESADEAIVFTIKGF